MTISEFTKPELDYFRQNCNFVNLEIKLFEERAQGISLEQIAEDLHMTNNAVYKRIEKFSKKCKKRG